MVDAREGMKAGVGIPDRLVTTGEIGILSHLPTSLNATYRLLDGKRDILDPSVALPIKVSLYDIPQTPLSTHNALQNAWNKKRETVTTSAKEWASTAAQASIALMYSHRENSHDVDILQAVFSGWGVSIDLHPSPQDMIAQKEAVAKAYQDNFLPQFGGAVAQSGTAHLAKGYIEGIFFSYGISEEEIGASSQKDNVRQITDDVARGKELLSHFLQRLFGDELLAQGFSMAVDAEFIALVRDHIGQDVVVDTLSDKEREVLTFIGHNLPISDGQNIGKPVEIGEESPGDLGLTEDVADFLQFQHHFTHLIREMSSTNYDPNTPHDFNTREKHLREALGLRSFQPWHDKHLAAVFATPTDKDALTMALQSVYAYKKEGVQADFSVKDVQELGIKAMQQIRGVLMDDLKVLGSGYARIVGDVVSGQLGLPWTEEAIGNLVDEVVRLADFREPESGEVYTDQKPQIVQTLLQEISLAGQIYAAYHILPIHQMASEVKQLSFFTDGGGVLDTQPPSPHDISANEELRQSAVTQYQDVRREMLRIMHDISRRADLGEGARDRLDERIQEMANHLGIHPQRLNQTLGDIRDKDPQYQVEQLMQLFSHSNFAYTSGVQLGGGIEFVDSQAKQNVRHTFEDLLDHWSISLPTWLHDGKTTHLTREQVSEMITGFITGFDIQDITVEQALGWWGKLMSSLPTVEDQIDTCLQIFTNLGHATGNSHAGRRERPVDGGVPNAGDQLVEWLNSATPLLPPVSSGEHSEDSWIK